MLNQRIHYRSVFALQRQPISSKSSVYQVVVELTRVWLKERHFKAEEDRESLYKPWLFLGGGLGHKWGTFTEVKVEGMDEVTNFPNHWILRLEHPDSKYTSRIWRVDVALTSENADRAEIAVTVSWYLKDDHIGDEPGVPSSSVPAIVQKILASEELAGYGGAKRLSPVAHKLQVGDGRAFYEYLLNPQRTMPVVLMNIHHYGDVIKPNGLQNLLLGSACVYWYDDPTVHQELHSEWGEVKAQSYQCGPDALRIYQTGINLSNYYDRTRHRYFSLKDAFGNADGLLRMVVQSILRITSSKNTKNTVFDFETLEVALQGKRLQVLRQAAAAAVRSKEENEYVEALEEDNTRLTHELAKLKTEFAQEQEQAVEWQMRHEEAVTETAGIKKQFGVVARSQEQYADHSAQLDKLRECWNKLPDSLHDALTLFQKLNPERIVVLEEAFESAEDAEFQHTAEAWELLMAMATDLHDILFSGGSTGDIEKDFKDRTGFELALSEGKMTKADPKIMESRRRIYRGEEVDTLARTKRTVKGHYLRIHYYPDTDRKLIVIGHCGDHDETAGSRRRKEK